MKSKVVAKWLVRVPKKASMAVGVGDVVKEGDILFTYPTEVIRTLDASIIFSKVKKEKLEEFNYRWRDKTVNEGDLLFETGGIFKKKVMSPCSGRFAGLDEFYNIKFEMDTAEKKESRSPVSAKVAKIEDGKLVLDFKAIEIEGRGLVAGKAWGVSEFNLISKISEINYSMEGKVIFTNNISSSFLAKAEVVGITGVVAVGENSDTEYESGIPVLGISQKTWDSLSGFTGKEEKLFINAKKDRLLIVVE